MSFTYIIKKFSFNSLYTKNIDTKPETITHLDFQNTRKKKTLNINACTVVHL